MYYVFKLRKDIEIKGLVDTLVSDANVLWYSKNINNLGNPSEESDVQEDIHVLLRTKDMSKLTEAVRNLIVHDVFHEHKVIDLDMFVPFNTALCMRIQKESIKRYTSEYGGWLRIVTAANMTHTQDMGDVMVIGVRHFDRVMNDQYKRFQEGFTKVNKTTQGFVDNFGNFHDRKEALKIAISMGQLIAKHEGGYELYSEDLH